MSEIIDTTEYLIVDITQVWNKPSRWKDGDVITTSIHDTYKNRWYFGEDYEGRQMFFDNSDIRFGYVREDI
tara:strand:+ start:7629 stop:7841 length:213 start_codon:yes stop_codon:yes gene_type:complete